MPKVIAIPTTFAIRQYGGVGGIIRCLANEIYLQGCFWYLGFLGVFLFVNRCGMSFFPRVFFFRAVAFVSLFSLRLTRTRCTLPGDKREKKTRGCVNIVVNVVQKYRKKKPRRVFKVTNRLRGIAPV